MNEIVRGRTLQTGLPKELRKQKDSSAEIHVPRVNPLEDPAYQERLRKLMQ
jgi:hypothetical protein